MLSLTMSLMEGDLAICRQAQGSLIPPWALDGEFSSITRTADELSIVCREELVPLGVQADRGWRALRVAGPLDFSLVGVLAAMSGPLAEAGVAVLAISTFDTDYLLVKIATLERAITVLCAAGHVVLA